MYGRISVYVSHPLFLWVCFFNLWQGADIINIAKYVLLQLKLDMMDDTMGIVLQAKTHHRHMLSTTEYSVYKTYRTGLISVA